MKIDNLDTYFHELRQTAPQIDPHLPTDDYVFFLHHAKLLAGMKHCQELRKDITPILLPGYGVSGNADREGRFVFGVSPGTYLVYVSADAGNIHAEWYEIVHLEWRQTPHLVQPTCSYPEE